MSSDSQDYKIAEQNMTDQKNNTNTNTNTHAASESHQKQKDDEHKKHGDQHRDPKEGGENDPDDKTDTDDVPGMKTEKNITKVPAE
jgi:hypothetical protein